ncbi:HET domain-containing protein [Fusarium keratoplasticum]|uniref:HET domain-containing protein n=1 Tax=Fusarium keratoplasticum TaxID=1328300 RepID=A0ACC0QMX1_9HYPO|nr:HET domain-containing protein [Fusarium keratoplasticum]KAI8657946.1 HET domain-containing protein [Fusarium keratoplasticum]
MDSLASLTHRLLGKSTKKTLRVLSEPRVLYGQNPNKIGYSYQGDSGALRMVLDAKIGDAIFSLFSRVYWRRIWIIQEVLLAREIRIVCGLRCMNWNKLNSFFGGMEISMLQSGSQFHGSQRASKIMNAPGYILVKEKAFLETNPQLKEQGAPISDLLLSFGNFECRDRRDKVYGMLGISSDIVDVNYAKSVQHIYNDVIRRIVRGVQMDTISKAEYFGRRLASALGIRMDDRQLIRTDSLFICPPRLLTWADERPFWENDPARVLPRSYYNHVTNILTLSMTPSRPTPQISQRAILSTENSLESSQALPPAGQISSQAVAPQIVQPTNCSSLYNEPDEESHFTVSHYSDASSIWVEDLESRGAHAPDLLVPDDQPRCKDDSEVPITSSRSVDYLSHGWTDEEIGPSWKAVSSAKSLINKSRLENGIWRAWTKFKNNLSTIPAEELNWLKDCDVTWLYGPLYPDSQPHPTDWQTDDKSILKRHRAFDSEFSSRGKKLIDLKVRIREEVEVISHDGGIGYFEDENDDDTAIENYTDTAL